MQLQVPFWLMTGRETLVLNEGGSRWRDVMRAIELFGTEIAPLVEREIAAAALP